jgi:hypothetical protein
VAGTGSVFISYRRETGFPWAKLVRDELHRRDVDAFLDVEKLDSAGHFDAHILGEITARPFFALVLTPGSLDRCREPDDWLRREIEWAVQQQRTIVPLLIEPFTLAEARRNLDPALAAELERSNGVTVNAEYFNAAMQTLVERRLRRRGHRPDDRWRRVAIGAGIAVTAILVAVVVAILLRPDDETSDRLLPEETLRAGDEIVSTDGRHQLEMRDDGELVASTGGEVWWNEPGSRSVAGSIAVMQGDGNFVIYADEDDQTAGGALFATVTQGNPDAFLVIADRGGEGVLEVRSPNGRVLWQETSSGASDGGASDDGTEPETSAEPTEGTDGSDLTTAPSGATTSAP